MWMVRITLLRGIGLSSTVQLSVHVPVELYRTGDRYRSAVTGRCVCVFSTSTGAGTGTGTGTDPVPGDTGTGAGLPVLLWVPARARAPPVPGYLVRHFVCTVQL